MGSGGETGIEMCGARATLWKIHLNNNSSSRIKAVFPSLTAILTIYMALLLPGCGDKRNLQ